MPSRRIDLCGVRIDLETDHAELARYVAAQFPDAPDADAEPDVVVRVRWTEGPRPVLDPATVFPAWRAETRVDRHVFLGTDAILCLQADDAPQIALASAPGRPRRFELRYHFALGAGWRASLTRAVRWRRVRTLRRSRLSTLVYYAVYYPAWWHLEARGGAHPLHAAAIALGGRALLLGGLPGCGKSTLATSFLGAADAELLSDNVVLHDAARVHGCFEPLLLDATTRTSLSGRAPLTPLGRRHVYGRDAYLAPHRTGGVPLAAAVVVARGRETRLTRLTSEECAGLLLAVSEAAKEVRRYHVLAALLGVLERDALAHFGQRVADLQRLLAGVPCYWLQVREGAPAEATPVLRELVRPAQEAAG